MNRIFFILASMLTISCGSSNNPASTKAPEGNNITISFSADSAYSYIERQVAFGPRVPGTESHTKCLDYLVATLNSFGAQVSVQEGEGIDFYGKKMPVRNIIAHVGPEKAKRVLLCSHWDCRPFADNAADRSRINEPIDGANDGASGVGIILEIARQLQQKEATVGVDILFFDVEDYGKPDHIDVEYRPDTWCLGSQYWGRSDEGQQCRARFGILLDMVGAPGAQFLRENFSVAYAANIVDKVWKAAETTGHGDRFLFEDGGYITDDHYYINQLTDVPCIDIIHLENGGTSFGAYWHTHDDTMKNIDRQTLSAVGETLLQVIYNER